jgi:hypothetical protein
MDKQAIETDEQFETLTTDIVREESRNFRDTMISAYFQRKLVVEITPDIWNESREFADNATNNLIRKDKERLTAFKEELDLTGDYRNLLIAENIHKFTFIKEPLHGILSGLNQRYSSTDDGQEIRRYVSRRFESILQVLDRCEIETI